MLARREPLKADPHALMMAAVLEDDTNTKAKATPTIAPKMSMIFPIAISFFLLCGFAVDGEGWNATDACDITKARNACSRCAGSSP